MSASVDVGGISVDQPTLERMFAALHEHGAWGVPEGYVPDLGRFGPIRKGETTASLEQYAYSNIAEGSTPEWFAKAFMEPPKPLPKKSPMGVLRDAGFPRIVWTVRAPWRDAAPEAVTAWAAELDAMCRPWLWVRCQDADRRADILAHVAMAADRHGMRDAITYKDARELCEEVNSADMYGEASKHNAMGPFCTCGLLILDNMGGERLGARELETLCSIVCERYRQMMPTAMGSAHGLADLLAAYSRIDRDRAKAMCPRIAAAMCGYRTIADSAERKAELMRHVVDV